MNDYDLRVQVESISHQAQEKIIRKYKRWQYKNITFLFLSLLIFFYFAESDIVQRTIQAIGNWGYPGAFIVGIFFASTFTIAPAMFTLYVLAENLNPYEVAIFAGLGGMFADFVIFKFLKNHLFNELKPFFSKLGNTQIARVFRTPFFMFFVPFIGAFLVAYPPVPDELGVGMLGLSRLKTWQFMILSFVLNATGIFLVVSAAKARLIEDALKTVGYLF